MITNLGFGPLQSRKCFPTLENKNFYSMICSSTWMSTNELNLITITNSLGILVYFLLDMSKLIDYVELKIQMVLNYKF